MVVIMIPTASNRRLIPLLSFQGRGSKERLKKMANFVLQLPKPNTFKCFSISASSNGTPPGSSSSSERGGPVILELPLDKIKRPLMRTRANDPNKVKELADSIKEIGLQVPVSSFYFHVMISCFGFRDLGFYVFFI